MKKKRIVFCIIFIVFAVVLCSISINEDASTIDEIIAALEKEGYQVAVKEADKSILRGARYCLTVNQNPDVVVTVYVYGSTKEAQVDAETITLDGFGIERNGTLGIAESMQISWVDAPHFFLYKNCIVQYIGMDFELLQLLYHLCGSQIAGQPFIDSPLID